MGGPRHPQGKHGCDSSVVKTKTLMAQLKLFSPCDSRHRLRGNQPRRQALARTGMGQARTGNVVAQRLPSSGKRRVVVSNAPSPL